MTTNFDAKQPKALGYSPILNLLKQDKMDGIYIPTDNLTFFKDDKAIEKLKLMPLPAPGGILYFKTGLHDRYGYETPEDFSHDVKLGLIECKTPEGALTLGPIRKLNASLQIYLYGSGLNSAPLFLADSPYQAQAIKKTLEKHYPGSTIRILTDDKLSSLDRLRPGMNPTYWKILLFKANPVIRQWFRYLVATAFMTILCLILDFFHYIGQTPTWIFLTAFLTCFLVFTGFVRLANSSKTTPTPKIDTKRKRPTKA